MNNNIGSSYRMTDNVTETLMKMYTSKNSESNLYPSFRGSDKYIRHVYRDVVPQNPFLYNRSCNFYIPRAADFITKVHLMLTFNGIQPAGSSFKQDISSLISRITLFFQGNILQIIYPDQISCKAIQDNFEKVAERTDRQGVNTLANRQILASGQAQYALNLETFLDHNNFPISLLGDMIRMEITLRDKFNVIQVQAPNLIQNVTGGDIVDAFLRIKYMYAKKDTLHNLAKLSLTTYGLFFPFFDSTWQQNVISAGSTQIRVLLSNIKGLVNWGCFQLRYINQVDDRTGSQAAEFTNTIPWSAFNIADSANKIYPGESQNDETYLENRFLRVEDMEAYIQPSLPGIITDYRGFFSFSHHSTDHISDNDEVINTGYYNFSASTSIYISLTLPAPLQSDAYLDVYAFHYNALNLINGVIKAYSLH